MEVAETRSLTPKFPAMDDLPKVSGILTISVRLELPQQC